MIPTPDEANAPDGTSVHPPVEQTEHIEYDG